MLAARYPPTPAPLARTSALHHCFQVSTGSMNFDWGIQHGLQSIMKGKCSPTCLSQFLLTEISFQPILLQLVVDVSSVVLVRLIAGASEVS